jgi:NADH-quinone oxidoreductase subunit G
MPCTAKKDEMSRSQYQRADGASETSAVLTVREFARLLELRGVAKRNDLTSFQGIESAEFDDPYGEGTGAAAIFGVTGGVAEAALRTAADVLSGQSLDSITYSAVRGLSGVKKTSLQLHREDNDEPLNLNVAVCNQMANVKKFLASIEEGNEMNYHFCEIMTCPGGCIGGGGLPQSRDPDILAKRVNGLYSIDERKVKRKSHENEDVKKLYEKVLGSPLSDISHKVCLARAKYVFKSHRAIS